MREFLLFIKYPYTAGILSVVWLGAACLLVIDPNLSLLLVFGNNLFLTVIIALIGFRGKREL